MIDSQMTLSAYFGFDYAYKILNQKADDGLKTLANLKQNQQSSKVDAAMLRRIERETLLFIPTIVMLAFSIEVGIKAIVISQGGTYGRVHELDKLFEKLQSATQTAIITSVCNEMKITKQDFHHLLTTEAKAFVNWRYFFEGSPTANYKLLQSLNQAIYSIAKSVSSNSSLI